MSYSFLVKYILVGDTRVGKSCLLLQYTDNRFKEEHDVTIGVEFGSKIVNIDNKIIKLQIWDTAGQESFRSITRSYYRGAAVAFIVFDSTNRNSFEGLNRWISEIKQNGPPSMVIFVIANQVDRISERCVSADEGLNFANQHSLIYAETSAMDKSSVDRVFEYATREVLMKVNDGTIDATDQSTGVKKGND